MNKNFNEKKEFKKIKENITEVEYKKLMSFVRGNETLRSNTKQNLPQPIYSDTQPEVFGHFESRNFLSVKL